MIRATSEMARYQTLFSDGTHLGVSDTTFDKGGGNAGFRPHELLEAALACCVTMTVRMYADNHGIALRDVTSTVTLNRSQPDQAVFEYEIELAGELTGEERSKLMLAASACPVRRTLSKAIRFECTPGPQMP
jgi:putative redox protein